MSDERRTPEPRPAGGQELLPCPFCGGVPQEYYGEPDEYGERHFVECLECQATTRVHADGGAAAEAWNTRAADPVRAALLAACKAIRDYEAASSGECDDPRCACAFCMVRAAVANAEGESS